jgi:hypothetical protein
LSTSSSLQKRDSIQIQQRPFNSISPFTFNPSPIVAKGIGWKIKPVGQLLLTQSNSIPAAAASCSPFVYLQSN